MHESNLRGDEVIAASPAEVVIGYENTSTSFISPAIHRKYASPCINDYADLLHEHGKIYLTHRCGTLQALVDEIREERDDGVVDISPEPTGNLPLWEAKEAWPDKVVLGGFDATFLTNWTTQQIRNYAREILERSNGLDRLILGSADAVPKTARTENLRAVGEFVKSWCIEREVAADK
jgi:uroporphyrinogen-III decarboxylase